MFAVQLQRLRRQRGMTWRPEDSPTNPLTPYARPEGADRGRPVELADETFTVTCLRFATACGMSDRVRLDLVLNDFVAAAIATQTITILSDGTPWRPLVHVHDMARAIDWAVQREPLAGSSYLCINAGSDEWNYRIKDTCRGCRRGDPRRGRSRLRRRAGRTSRRTASASSASAASPRLTSRR